MSIENRPNQYSSDSQKVQEIAKRVNRFMSESASEQQLLYFFGQDVKAYVPNRLKQQSPNAREITTYAQKISPEPLYHFVAFSKTIEDGQPDLYRIIILDNSEKSHTIIEFNSESSELVLTKTADPNFVEYIRGDSLNIYSTYFNSDKLIAIEEKDTINLSTCYRLMLSLGVDYGK